MSKANGGVWYRSSCAYAVLTASADGTFNPYANFNYTGSLRPKYPLSPKRVVPDHIKRPDYAEDGAVKKFFRGFSLSL